MQEKPERGGTTMAENFPGETPDLGRDARQLELVDRIIGLEAELAHLRASASTADSLRQLDEIHSSATWRIGRAVIAPIAAVRRVVRGTRG